MLLFVAAYLLQHWAFAVYSLWMLIEHPDLVITTAVTLFSNQGGVCNFVIFVQMQRQRRRRVVDAARKRKEIKARMVASYVRPRVVESQVGPRGMGSQVGPGVVGSQVSPRVVGSQVGP